MYLGIFNTLIFILHFDETQLELNWTTIEQPSQWPVHSQFWIYEHLSNIHINFKILSTGSNICFIAHYSWNVSFSSRMLLGMEIVCLTIEWHILLSEEQPFVKYYDPTFKLNLKDLAKKYCLFCRNFNSYRSKHIYEREVLLGPLFFSFLIRIFLSKLY